MAANFITFHHDYLLLSLSTLSGPVTEVEVPILDIRVYEGIEGTLEIEDDIMAVIEDEDMVMGSIVEEDYYDGVVVDEEAVVGSIVEEEGVVGVIETDCINVAPPTHSVFWGLSMNPAIGSEAEIRSLGNEVQLPTPELTAQMSPSLEYFYYAFPSSFDDPGVFGFEIGNFGPGDVQKLSDSIDVGGQPYTLYRSDNILDYPHLSFKVVV